jgi:CBS domain-containing protein
LSEKKQKTVETQPEREVCTTFKVEDVMVKEAITIDVEMTVKEAADLMNKFEIGSIIAVDKGKAVGILTERDLLRRIVAEGRDPEKIRVKDVMTSPLIVAEPEMDLAEAIKLMFQLKIKKLPVVEGTRLVGLVGLTDIARFQPQMMTIIKQLAKKQITPKSMQKVIDRYVV